MTSVLDLWRAIDPRATLASGAVEQLTRPVRGAVRTRAAAPHLPQAAEGQLLIVEASIVVGSDLDPLVTAITEADLRPAAVWIAGAARRFDAAGDELPVLAGDTAAATLAQAAAAYFERETELLTAIASEMRLAAAEAALGDPQPSAPAGVVAARLHRGVAVSVAGSLSALHSRPAGRALATRFAAAFLRSLAGGDSRAARSRRTRDGLWILERPIDANASVWAFDDLPFARIDEVALDALAVTLRALLRRAPSHPAPQRRPKRAPPSTGDPLRDTLLAVARANGRVAPAARSLGVHRNTVLYRLRRASAELGIDPRRPDDALRLLGEEG